MALDEDISGYDAGDQADGTPDTNTAADAPAVTVKPLQDIAVKGDDTAVAPVLTAPAAVAQPAAADAQKPAKKKYTYHREDKLAGDATHYKLRAIRLEDGTWDTITHAAEAAVHGSGKKSTAANIDQAVLDLVAKYNQVHKDQPALQLVHVRLEQEVINRKDPKTGELHGYERYVTTVLDTNGKPTSESVETPWKLNSHDGLPFSDLHTGEQFPEGKQETCTFYDYRHHDKKLSALKPGFDELPLPDGYKAFSPPLDRVRSDCATCQKPIASPPPVKAAPAPEPEKVYNTIHRIPLAVFVPAQAGTRDIGQDYSLVEYFDGGPVRDVAAKFNQAKGKASPDGQEITPADSEGTRTGFDQRDAKAGLVNTGEEGDFDLTHDSGEEVTYRTAAHYRVLPDGTLVPNASEHQKVQMRLRRIINDDGQIVTIEDGSARISKPRRDDPYHSGLFTDHATASTVITAWGNSGEAPVALKAYSALTDAYPDLRKKFETDQAPSAKDAESLLQTNVMLALSPVVWSTDPRGVARPLGNTDVLKADMESIFASPAFAKLPQADQDRLRQTYQPLEDKLKLPNALALATGDRSDWFNPLNKDVPERAKIDYVNDGFYKGKVHPEDKDRDFDENPLTDKEKRARTEEYGYMAAKQIMKDGVRPPSEFELEVGTGRALDTAREKKDTLAQQRIAFLERVQHDPQFRHDVIEHVVNTPGAVQFWTEPAFLASKTTATAGNNPKILGFDSPDDAAHFAKYDVGQKLAGDMRLPDQYGNPNGPKIMDRMAYADRAPIDGTLSFLTVGHWRPGAAKNLNRGVEGVQEAAKTRWDKGGAEQAEVDQAFISMARQAEIAQKNGVDVASTSIVNSMSPRLDEYRNNGQQSDLYKSLVARTGTLFADQTIVNTPYLPGGTDLGTKEQVVQGQNVQTVSNDAAETDIQNAVKGGVTTTTDTTPLPPGAKPSDQWIYSSTLNMNQTYSALQDKSGFALPKALATTSDASKVSQVADNKAIVSNLASDSPVTFSLFAIRAMAQDDANGRKLYAAAGHLLHSGVYSEYGNKIRHYANQLRAAETDQERAEISTKAAQDLAGFFAGKGDEDPAKAAARALTVNLAVSRFAGEINSDNGLSAGIAGQYAAISDLPDKLQAAHGNLAALTASDRQLNALFAGLRANMSPDEFGAFTRQLLALNAGAADASPADRAQDLRAFLAAHGSSIKAAMAGLDANMASVDASHGTSAIDLALWITILAWPHPHGGDVPTHSAPTKVCCGKDIPAPPTAPGSAPPAPPVVKQLQ